MRFSLSRRPRTLKTHALGNAREAEAVQRPPSDSALDRLINLELEDFLTDVTATNGLMSASIGIGLACLAVDQPLGYIGALVFSGFAILMHAETRRAKANIRHRDACSRIRADTANREAVDLEIELHKRCSEHAQLYRTCLMQAEMIRALADAGTEADGADYDDAPSAEVVFMNGKRSH